MAEGRDRPSFVDRVRQPASLSTEFEAGSDRAGVGPAVRMTKRLLRRSFRWYLEPIVEQQSRLNHAFLDLLEELSTSVDQRLEQDATGVKRRIADTEVRLDRLRADLDALDASSEAAGQASPVGAAGVAGAVGAAARPAEGAGSLRPSTRLSLAYKAFEDRHRGGGDDIRELLRRYLPFFAGCRRVLDVGCGRGEFLSLLRDEGISAYGVDVDEGMVEACRKQGLEVFCDEALHHLNGLAPGAIDGVFSSQVVEHLSTTELMSLLDAIYRKLDRGGVFVVETPNPESLFVFSSFFYVDLTHVRPVHPEAMAWALGATGFADVHIERVLPVPDEARLQPVPEDRRDDPAWSAMATNVERLNALLYGPQHFAAVATKPGRRGEDGAPAG
jgi:SAM-dependent methyltransferase